jgi:hypothetical protein
MRAWIICVVFAACDAYDTDLGPSPYFCGDTPPRCPTGYACVLDPSSGEEVCVDGTPSGNFDCDDDSAYEPNNTLDTATPTTITSSAPATFMLDGLAVCPARDRDLFAMTLSGSASHIELTVSFGASGAMLTSAILNAGGIPIASGMATAEAPRTLRASARNLPPGIYYAQVTGPDATMLAQNNYTLAITVSAP